jgi:CRISPR-associated protein Csd2
MNRFDFVLGVDVCDGNPNGDPAAGNVPRTDPETRQGLISDVCIKRKMRDYVARRYDSSLTLSVDGVNVPEGRFNIYVNREKIPLNLLHAQFGAPSRAPAKGKRISDEPEGAKGSKAIVEYITRQQEAQRNLCNSFWDVRTFGAVMSTRSDAGVVRGPVQLTFGRSYDPITWISTQHTRVVSTREENVLQGVGMTDLGARHLVRYGLYRFWGSINPFWAKKTGFDEGDLQLTWEALERMFYEDSCASRAVMTTRFLVAGEHQNELGCCPAVCVFDTVRVVLRSGVSSPSCYADYEVSVGEAPKGVTLHVLIRP